MQQVLGVQSMPRALMSGLQAAHISHQITCLRMVALSHAAAVSR